MKTFQFIMTSILLLISSLVFGQEKEADNAPKKSIRNVCTHSTYRVAAEPLYIVDNVIVDKEFIKEIDPESIQSVSVLKDKGTQALYGTSGKNGVIIIETKQAKQKKIKMPQETKIEKIVDTIQ